MKDIAYRFSDAGTCDLFLKPVETLKVDILEDLRVNPGFQFSIVHQRLDRFRQWYLPSTASEATRTDRVDSPLREGLLCRQPGLPVLCLTVLYSWHPAESRN